MAEVVIFEDNIHARKMIRDILQEAFHNVTGEATTITEAHELLTRLALGEVAAHYALIDGSLGTPPLNGRPAFHFTPPNSPPPKTTPKLFGLFPRPAQPNPHEIVVEAEQGYGMGIDGRQITRIIQACQLPLTKIAISNDPATYWDYDKLIDHDITKNGILLHLPPLIESLEHQRETKSD